MIPYLIKTILCSAFFILFYKTVLGESKSYNFNRFYLIAALALSFIIPVLPMPVHVKSPLLATYLIPVLQETEEAIFAFCYPVSSTSQIALQETEAVITPALQMKTTESQSGHNPLFFIYFLITGILICRSLHHLYRLRKNILKSNTQKSHGVTLVFSNNISSTYTFMNYIFVQCNRSLPEEIIKHEMTHVRQRHTLDILFVELLLTFCWFNPVLLLYRKYIALNHEYLADENVLKNCTDEKRYLNILLSVCGSKNNMALSHQFNNNRTIKKRVKMIMKTNSKTVQWLRFTAIAPLFAASFLLFSGSSYIKAENPRQQDDPQQVTTAVNDDAPKSSTEKDALHKEYMQIIEKYLPENGGKSIIRLNSSSESDLAKKDLKRMNEILQSMTPEQISALPFIFQQIKMPDPKTPTAAEYESWKEPSEYGVWLNGKRIDNSELNKYQPSDFSHYFKSRLTRTAKNYGKHVYQLDISTHSYYEVQKADMDAAAIYFITSLVDLRYSPARR